MNDISYHMQFFIKTPTHGDTLSFQLDMYQWSDSWANFLINATDSLSRQTRVDVMAIKQKSILLNSLNFREEAILSLHIKTQSRFETQVTVQTYPQSEHFQFVNFQ